MNMFRGHEYPSHFRFTISDEERLFAGQIVGSATLLINGKDGPLPIPEENLVWNGTSVEAISKWRRL